jgi:hypothetical protein
VTSSNFVTVGSLDAPGQTDTASVPEIGVSSGVLVSFAEFAGQEGQELGVLEPGGGHRTLMPPRPCICLPRTHPRFTPEAQTLSARARARAGCWRR